MKIESAGEKPYAYELDPGVWDRQSVKIDDRTYFVYINRDNVSIDPEEWVDGKIVDSPRFDDGMLPPDIAMACRLWIDNNLGMSMCQYLQTMFGEQDGR